MSTKKDDHDGEHDLDRHGRANETLAEFLQVDLIQSVQDDIDALPGTDDPEPPTASNKK